MPRVEPALLRKPVAFQQIAAAARGDDIGPYRGAAARPRHDVVEGELVRGARAAAILAAEAVAQEHVEPGEGRVARRLDIFLEGNDARQAHLEGGAADIGIVMVDDIDPLEEHRLDRVLPRPERQWEIAERPK